MAEAAHAGPGREPSPTNVVPTLSLRRDALAVRRCRRCGEEAPAELESCRQCGAALGERFERPMLLVAPKTPGAPAAEPPAQYHGPHAAAWNEQPQLPPRAVAAVALALELSGPPFEPRALLDHAGEQLAHVLAALSGATALVTLPSGVLVALLHGRSLLDGATAAARAAASLRPAAPLEWRAGIAAGLLDGTDPWRARMAACAARLARAAQPNQTLATYAIAELLERDWQFVPVGPRARRHGDAIAAATLLTGPKPPAPAPSALAPVGDALRELVGRERELAALDHELDRARGGAVRWSAVVAPAGGGKSRLLRTWLGGLEEGTARVAGAAASPFGQAPGALAGDLVEALMAVIRANDSAAERSGVLAAAVEGAAGADLSPLIAVIDDLHWADAESLAALRDLAATTRPAGCLVVVALRSSFLPRVPWLRERATIVELPPLDATERAALLRRLLPDPGTTRLRRTLARAPAAGNPLYLEQAAALLLESPDAGFPASLHEAILRRLERVLARVARAGLDRPTPEELAEAERTIGEWLDRLETGDLDDRVAIAEYLRLLERIDAALVIAASIGGAPVRRNRRLAAAIERFYAAGFAERRDAIERLAEWDPPNASHAAASAAERAIRSVRLEDATGYLELAVRLSQGEARGRHLRALGDVLLVRGLATRAYAAFEAAREHAREDRLRASCERRLARAALACGRRVSERALEGAIPLLAEREQAIATCDLAVLLALGCDNVAAGATLDSVEPPSGAAGLCSLRLRTRLRLALLDGRRNLEQHARECSSALVFDGDPLADRASLIETVLLLRRATPALVDPTLLAEARHAARRLGNSSAESALRAADARASWRPIHPDA